MPKLTINDIELYYEVQGDGIPLLLIAGLASDSQSWQPIIGELTSRCQVITVDNRGVGRTSPLDVETSVHTMATDCIALVKHLGLKSLNILGHSMGGFVAQECAIHYPEYVDILYWQRRHLTIPDGTTICSQIGPVLWKLVST